MLRMVINYLEGFEVIIGRNNKRCDETGLKVNQNSLKNRRPKVKLS